MFAASLPDLDSLDLEAAKALLIAQHQSYTATLSSSSTEVERLMLLVEKLQRMLFGRKSEKVLRQIEQLELQLEELQAANAIEEHAAAASVARPIAAKLFRRPLPEHLPREIHTHMPDHEACPDCGGRLRVLGEDTAEMLEHVRACFKVIRHVRPKMSCDACDRIVQAPAPSRPIDRGLAGPGLLAHVLVSKYADHVPLYRQSEIYSREGLSSLTLMEAVPAMQETRGTDPSVGEQTRPGRRQIHQWYGPNGHLVRFRSPWMPRRRKVWAGIYPWTACVPEALMRESRPPPGSAPPSDQYDSIPQ
jgi:transposase